MNSSTQGQQGPLLDPADWDNEMSEAAEAVFDGMCAAAQIKEKLTVFPVLGLSVLDIYDRLQDQLRTPVLVSAPDGMSDE